MLRKILFNADIAMGRIARRYYKTHNVDSVVTYVLDRMADFICWLDVKLTGTEKFYEALCEYAEIERERNIKAGIYVDPWEGTVEKR